MDFMFIVLVGLSSMFNTGKKVAETRNIPVKNHLKSYDYYDSWKSDEFDSTTGTVKRDQDGADFGSSGLEEFHSSSAPFHPSPKTFAGNSQEDDYEDSGSSRQATQGYMNIESEVDENEKLIDSAIGNKNDGSYSNYFSPDKFNLPTYTFHFVTIAPKYVSENVNDEYEFPSSGNDNVNGEDSYRDIFIRDYDNNDTEVNVEVNTIRKSSFYKISSQRYHPQTVNSNSDDEDFGFSGTDSGHRDEEYELSGSGDGSGDENNIASLYTSSRKTFYSVYTTLSRDTYEQGYYPKTFIPDHHYYSENEGTKNQNEVYFPRISSLEITTQKYFSKNIASDSNDEEFEYSGSDNGSGGEHIPNSSDIEITTRYLQKNIVTDSGDEDYDSSGSGDGSRDENNIDSLVTSSKNIFHSLYTTSPTGDTNEEIEYSGSGNGNGREHDTHSLDLEITIRYLPKNIVSCNEDEDYELSGSGEGSNDGNDTNCRYSEKNVHSLFITSFTGKENHNYNGNDIINGHTERNPPIRNSFEILGDKDDKLEFSGSSERSGENDSNYISDNNTSNVEVISLSRIGVFDLTRDFSKNFVTDSDDEDYDFSGSGEESGDRIDTDYLYGVSEEALNSPYTTLSSVKNNDTKNGIKAPIISSFEITTKKYNSENIASDNDDEKLQYSNTVSGRGKGSDTDSLFSGSDNGKYISKNDIMNVKGVNPLRSEIFEITTQFLSENIFVDSDDEDNEFSGGDEGSGNESHINPDHITEKIYPPYNTLSTRGPDAGDHYRKTIILFGQNDSDDSEIKNKTEVNLTDVSSVEITTQTFHSKIITPDSDDEEYTYSGSGDEDRRGNDTDSSKGNVTYSDDEDYELSGSGVGSGEGIDSNSL